MALPFLLYPCADSKAPPTQLCAASPFAVTPLLCLHWASQLSSNPSSPSKVPCSLLPPLLLTRGLSPFWLPYISLDPRSSLFVSVFWLFWDYLSCSGFTSFSHILFFAPSIANLLPSHLYIPLILSGDSFTPPFCCISSLPFSHRFHKAVPPCGSDLVTPGCFLSLGPNEIRMAIPWFPYSSSFNTSQIYTPFVKSCY